MKTHGIWHELHHGKASHDALSIGWLKLPLSTVCLRQCGVWWHGYAESIFRCVREGNISPIIHKSFWRRIVQDLKFDGTKTRAWYYTARIISLMSGLDGGLGCRSPSCFLFPHHFLLVLNHDAAGALSGGRAQQGVARGVGAVLPQALLLLGRQCGLAEHHEGPAAHIQFRSSACPPMHLPHQMPREP